MRLIDISKYDMNSGYINWLELEDNCIERYSEPLYAIPTVDAVPIIRCKDCINWDTDWTTHPPDHYCPAIDQFTSADFYCGYSEKKDLKEQKCTSTATQP